MKILHIVKTSTGAGWVYQQVRVLRSLGLEILVALPSDSGDMARKYREAGAQVVPLALDFPAKQPWRIPAVLQACRNLVGTVQPDVIHTHHVGPTLIVRAALGKSSPIPRIFQVPGPLHLEHSFFARLDISSAGPPDHWIACCRWTEEKYRSLGVRPEHIFLSYPGTDLTAFSTVRTQSLRRELRLTTETPLVGMVCYMYSPKRFLGQTTGLKGHEDFIAAFRIAQRTLPDLRAVVIGGAWNGATRYEEHLRKLGQRVCRDSMTFLGTRSDVPALYPDLDLAVVASHSENVGGAVEPLLSGVPVVSTNVGGLPDLVRPGRTGRLVSPRDTEALAEAIVSSMHNRAESLWLALEGQKLAKRLFNVETTAREVAEIYGRVCPMQLARRRAS